jgi:hypothetical protein
MSDVEGRSGERVIETSPRVVAAVSRGPVYSITMAFLLHASDAHALEIPDPEEVLYGPAG